MTKRSTDDGKTWTSLTLFYSNSTDVESNVIGNAAPVVDRNSGRIWVPFCRNNEQVFISYSDDDGMTWSEPVYQPQLVKQGHPHWKWIGLGPPSGIQLSTGRLLIPSYHTNGWKGDGLISRGHTLYSDDYGETWKIGSEEFGRPYFVNECQAVELKNGSVLINSRSLTNVRIQIISNDGGLSFNELPYVVSGLTQPLEGCEGSFVRDPVNEIMYFSDPYTDSPVRTNLTVFKSYDEGLNWDIYQSIDRGSVAYSSLNVISNNGGLEILYERSDNVSLIFTPDQIIYYKIN